MLENGKLILDSDTVKVVDEYLDQNLNMEAAVSAEKFDKKIEGVIKRENSTIKLKRVALLNKEGLPCNFFQSNEEVTISVAYECLTDVVDLRLVLQIVDEENRPILLLQNSDDTSEAVYYERKSGQYTSSCTIPANTFGQKRFYVSFQLINIKIEHLILNKILMFDVNFQGYNMQYGEYADVFFRPLLKWKTQFLNK